MWNGGRIYLIRFYAHGNGLHQIQLKPRQRNPLLEARVVLDVQSILPWKCNHIFNLEA